MTGASEAEAREFAAAYRSFLDWVHRGQGGADEVVALVTGFLGADGSEHSVVNRSLAPSSSTSTCKPP